ncbi:MAG: HIT family protein [Chlorobi bacterium]|jgi:histidine triad (HIT) family protein|nr:HIT family protein [Chlorobiota bacterium]
MSSIFTKIINREIPAYIVAEDDKHIAFLDIFPVAKGHVLAVPKKEVDKLFDLPEEDYKDLMLFSRKVAKALEKAFPDVNRIGMAVIGLEVPHVHVHLVPINRMSDMDFGKKLSLSEDEFKEIQQRIVEAFKD